MQMHRAGCNKDREAEDLAAQVKLYYILIIQSVTQSYLLPSMSNRLPPHTREFEELQEILMYLLRCVPYCSIVFQNQSSLLHSLSWLLCINPYQAKFQI